MLDTDDEQEEIDELEPSELGTKDYWDSVYKRDVKYFKSHGDVGEIWFEEASALRIMRWILMNIAERDVSIIDLGCGNGMLLIELFQVRYTNLTGVDYCHSAIELAQSVAESREISNITFKVADLTGDVGHLGRFKLAVDKGTYDAISLNPEDAAGKRRYYIQNILTLLEERGTFIITSCNWTETELIQQFKQEFELLQIIPTPKFQFGENEGSLVSTVVFRKKRDCLF